MTSHFKQLALAGLRAQRRKIEIHMDSILRAYTEQEGWTFLFDPADGHDQQRQADNAFFAGHLEVAGAGLKMSTKEVTVYRGPGYPVDPELENRRRTSVAFRSLLGWNQP